MKKLILLAALLFLTVFPQNILAKSVSGKISVEVDLSGHGESKEAQLWLPYPVSNANQTVSNIKIEGTYASSGVYTDKKYQTPILYAKWPAGVKERKLVFNFDVERQEFIHKDFPSEEACWDSSDYKKYLSATRLGPIDGEVKKLAEEIVKGKKTVLAKAKAIYDWTCLNTYRNPETRGCGMGDVYHLLKEPGGKCTDISSIYIALCRAAGVPARETFGIRMGKKDIQDITTWEHCWAEFYLPGYGWVPVDPADVRKMMLKNNLTLDNPATDKYRRYFWGCIDAYRIKLGEGRDLVLNPPNYGEPLNYLMYPFAQIGEKTIDWLNPETFKYKITYRKIK